MKENVIICGENLTMLQDCLQYEQIGLATEKPDISNRPSAQYYYREILREVLL